MNRPLVWFGLVCLVCMILPTFIGIISIVDIAHGQTSPQQSAPYSNQFPQPNQNPVPNQQQGQQQPQPQQGPFVPQQQQQQPQYPPQLQQQFQSPPQQQQQQQPPAGFGVLMNESKVMNCLHSVLHGSVDKAFKHAAGLNEATFMNNATSTLDSCILP